MKRYLLVATAAIWVSGAVGSAEAAPISLDITFSASNFSGLPPVPYDPVDGRFSVSFDNGSDHFGETNGISLLGITLPFVTSLVFDYSSSADLLIVGGTDFLLLVPDISTAPVGTTLFYADAGDFYASDTIALTAVPIVATPEPGALLLMGAGLCGLAALRRRRPRA